MILNMDDDVSALKMLSINEDIVDHTKSTRWNLVDLQGADVYDLISSAFAKLVDSRSLPSATANIFGLYPVKNGFFMKDLPELTYDLRFCVGTMWGCINRKSITLTLDEKEDFERTLLFWQNDGAVLRFNHVVAVTKYYKTPGGMQALGIDRKAASKISCATLCERFPSCCKLYTGKKNGMCEVRLMSKPKP